MKIVFNRKKLCASFPPLLCAVSTRSTIPAIEGVLIEAGENGECVMTTYDTEKGIRLSVEATVYSAGSCIINAQKLYQVVRVMDGEEIELSVDEKLAVRISCGKSTHRMSALPASDFPSMPDVIRDRGFVIPQALLKKTLGQVAHSMGIEDPRQILNGCYFKVNAESLTLVSCDSFKLSKSIKSIALENKSAPDRVFDYKFIVPVKTINELMRLLDDGEEGTLTVFVNRRYIVFIVGEVSFFSRLVDGEYIDYDRIIVKDQKIEATLSRAALIAALERAALVTEEKIAGSVRANVKLEFSDDLLKIYTNSTAGATYDELPIEHKGENILIAFNNRYLIDTVRASTGDEIRLSLSSPLTSMNVEPVEQPENTEEIFMLLPVRMKE